MITEITPDDHSEEMMGAADSAALYPLSEEDEGVPAPVQKTDPVKNFFVFANSTALYILTFMLVHGVYHGATALAALVFRIKVFYGLSAVRFFMNNDNWYHFQVVVIFTAGPVACLFAARLFTILFRFVHDKRTFWKTFIFWGVMHTINFSFGSVLSGVISHSGVWHALEWLVYDSLIITFLAVWMLPVLLVIGLIFTIPFLKCCDSWTLILYPNRKKLMQTSLIGPWLAGSLFLNFLKYPYNTLYEQVLYGTMVFLLIPIYIFSKECLVEATVAGPRRTRLEWRIILPVLIAVLIFRIALKDGLILG
jgi:hypothetical protein